MRDFKTDLHDPDTQRAEELVYAYLHKTYGRHVVDVRDSYAAYDFVLQQRIDVKSSRWLAREDRVHYEFEHVHHNGQSKPGWAVNLDLDVVVYVNRRTWEAHFIRMTRWRAHIEDRLFHAQEMGLDKPVDWILSKSRNRAYTTLAWSMPLAELREAGKIVVHTGRLVPAQPAREGAA